jgi:dynactin complex subunit
MMAQLDNSFRKKKFKGFEKIQPSLASQRHLSSQDYYTSEATISPWPGILLFLVLNLTFFTI